MKKKKENVKETNQFYSLKNILQYKAQYNVIFGERSNGKTYACLLYGLRRYIEKGEQFAIVRRWSEDFIGKRGMVMFDSIIANGEIDKMTNGEYNTIHYYASKWYLAYIPPEGGGEKDKDEVPFCYAFSINAMEHDKSTSYPNITTVVFDEFISRTGYMNDEFVLFMNVLSTIIRQRTNVTIFMLGNTVNRYCPYFNEMGLKHVKEMKQGTIDTYQYGTSDLLVAVEYCKPRCETTKASDRYFAFDNPKLNMITKGAWELTIYPHCPCKYKPRDVVYRYYIIFNDETVECEVVLVDDMEFTFIHPKTTDIRIDEDTLIYTTEYNPNPHYRRLLFRPQTRLEEKIARHFAHEKVYFATNETGELVSNYLRWAKKSVS